MQDAVGPILDTGDASLDLRELTAASREGDVSFKHPGVGLPQSGRGEARAREAKP